ncbi:single-stranded DNA-binding protein [Bradyrhizobium australafricanum]|uniref:single-stranded DNA-binding protein n=1 Tax=Bradyrhizobium australafricanum TaxID=2821406 RepID=UPI001CE35E2F|nr:single-stranded DNA-binding protein [Bradyrhizobium australafricanum]MCA6105374.1 single-stranded DNA-binding protein [Bradyrhizobium australafricanum]
MTQLCEVNQIGRVGKIKEVGQNLMISVASDASYKKDGEWVDRANWVEHTIFARQDGMLKWAGETLKPGDLVFVRSTPSQSSWEKDGEKHYGVTFAVNELRLEVARADLKGADQDDKPASRKKAR